MTESTGTPDPQAALDAAEAAAGAGRLTPGAFANIRRWLTQPGYAAYRPALAAMIAAARFEELEAQFWEVIPFGTGGRRGAMTEVGSATMNGRTVAESANGIAVYLRKAKGREGGRAVIAHDTRLRSREFAELTACVLAAQGMQVYLFDSHRATPELSFAVRHLKCDVGVMISASHNPPCDNGVKAYWSNGGQVLPPHDKGIIDCVYESDEIPRVELAQALADGRVELVGEDLDAAYVRAVLGQSLSSARDIGAVFTPLHGVGETSVYRVLEEAGFEGVSLFEPQRAPDGTFANVPQQLPNPERDAVYGPPAQAAAAQGAQLVLASDPDADRLGVAVRDGNGNYRPLSGNALAALLVDYILRKRKSSGTLGPAHYVVTTLVTTPLVGAIARSYKVRVVDDLLVGFKYIAQAIDREGGDRFVFGCEESLGYLAGSYARDKDAAVAALHICECAAELKKQGKTLLDRLDELYLEHGYHAELQRSETCRGAQGKGQLERLIERLTRDPPTALAGIALARVRDFRTQEVRELPENEWLAELPGPRGDLIFLESARADFEIGFAARPSGTEPKIKFYFFARSVCGAAETLSDVKSRTDARLGEFADALIAWVRTVLAAP
jgi:phosphoglucomutase/phosphomannomutase